jgi:anion-transporting  ArsA/GET3 family ATPase
VNDLEQLLAAREIVVTCGAGGVGKTTTAAALAALAATELGGRVLVLTVDPARRLADAMGVGGLGNEAVRVPDEAFAASGARPRGELWAAMLDTKQGWDDLVRRHAPDPTTRDAILANPLYDTLTGRMVQSHDYVAMERLHELHASGEWDLIVVDTPPSRHAIDFLEAPGRMADFFTSRFLRILVAPSRHRLIGMASRPFYAIADKVLGAAFLRDIAEFFGLLESMYDGFVERARAVERVLSDERTAFVVVTTLSAVPVREAMFFVDALRERHLQLGAIVLNKVLPPGLLDVRQAALAARLAQDAPALASRVCSEEPMSDEASADDVEMVARVLAEVGDSFGRLRVVAQREAVQRAALEALGHPVVAVPQLDHDVVDLASLLAVGTALRG